MGGLVSMIEQNQNENINLILTHLDNTLSRHRQNGIKTNAETLA